MRGDVRLALVAAVLLACSPPPPKPPPPAPAPDASTPAPPPKCESLDEACLATDATHARIQASGFTLRPPLGWKYAQEANDLFAETTLASLAVTAEPVVKTDDAALASALGRAADRVGARVSKKAPLALSKKPTKILEVGTLHVSLLVVSEAIRADKKGAAAVFWTKLPSNVVIVGVGFVDDADSSGADQAIVASVSTLAAGAAP
jgi:hypothetical protein